MLVRIHPWYLHVTHLRLRLQRAFTKHNIILYTHRNINVPRTLIIITVFLDVGFFSLSTLRMNSRITRATVIRWYCGTNRYCKLSSWFAFSHPSSLNRRVFRFSWSAHYQRRCCNPTLFRGQIFILIITYKAYHICRLLEHIWLSI